jgi:arylsulfatase A
MPDRPSFVVIVADDMGYGDFGIFSDGSAKTPALDTLAGESVVFTQHYSAAPVCAPARAALLTGRYPHRTGAIDTLEGRGLDRLGLGERTIGDLLRAEGYATGLVGKWHLGALDRRYHPNARGFDEFAGFRGGWSDYYSWRLDRNGAFERSDGRYLTDVLTDEALGFIRRHRAEPFFLHLAYNAPHYPFQVPAEDSLPFRETGRFTERVSVLYGMIARMDRGIGRILEELGRLGLRENTVVLFTSDNGPQFGGEGPESTRRYNLGLGGAKCDVLEGGIRVPALLRWPGRLAGGRLTSSMVHFADWTPTFLAMAGARPTASGIRFDGQVLDGLLRGESSWESPPRYWQWNRYTPVVTSNAAVREGDLKLVRPAIRETMVVSPADLDVDRRLKYEPDSILDISRDDEPARSIPLPGDPLHFDLAADPLERVDLAAERPKVAARLLGMLEDWFAEVDAERRRGES